METEKNLNILLIAHIRWFNAEVQYAVDLGCAMKRNGHRVLFFGQTDSPGVAKARQRGLETSEESGFNAKGLKAGAAVGAARRLFKLLKKEQFDAVEIHRPEGLPLIAWACKSAGIPAIRVRGDMRPVRNDPLNRFVHKKLLSGIIASNLSIEKMIRKRFDAELNLKTIHGGVDHELFKPEGLRTDLRRSLGFSENTCLVGILGRLGNVKGHDDFLSAARISLEKGVDASFVIMAKNEHSGREKELRTRIEADSLLRTKVKFLGWQNDLPSVLRSFDVGVIASTGSEANCRVGLEWMSSGVPLIASKVGVLPDLIEDGENGFLIPPANPSAMADKIVYLAKPLSGGGCATDNMKLAARSSVLKSFTLDRCALQHEVFLRSII